MSQDSKIGILHLFLLLLCTITAIVQSANAMTTEPIITASTSQSDSLDSKIAAAQRRAESFSESANTWNKWYVRGLLGSLIIGGLSLIVASCTVAFQWFAIRDSRRFSDTQSELLHLKDIKADEDSRAKEQQLAELRSQNITAGRALEKETIARMRIEEKVAWRRIEDEKKTLMATKLFPFKGQMARLWYNQNDLEASTFALDIASILQSAAWNIAEPQPFLRMREGPVPMGTNPPLETGVKVFATPHESARKAGAALVHELTELGFDATLEPKAEQRQIPLVIVNVEHRPEGAQGAAKLRLRTN